MPPDAVETRTSRLWTLSWLGLVAALALHVVDEAAFDFLAFWNPFVGTLRERMPGLPLPTFSFSVWFGGLVIGVLVLTSLSIFVRRGARWMRPLSYVFAVMMVGNGLFHLVGTLYLGRMVPGVYSSPLLLIMAVVLFVAARRRQTVG